MAILEMKHISKAFSGVYANENIDLSVEKEKYMRCSAKTGLERRR